AFGGEVVDGHRSSLSSQASALREGRGSSISKMESGGDHLDSLPLATALARRRSAGNDIVG
ncbi:MAG: hypothetical protein J0H61_14505, partial [Alphaproteobacteria bacterium]|nr:hypothetical protein [Alphaproteobacteria bacterium]